SWEIKSEECVMPDGRPMTIHQRYTWNMGEKAKLREHLEAWRGKPFTLDEIDSFNTTKLLGAPCVIIVVHNVSNDRTYSNVGGIGKAIKGQNIGQLANETVFLSLHPEEFDQDVFARLPERLQETIKDSPEFQRLGHSPRPPNGTGMKEA